MKIEIFEKNYTVKEKLKELIEKKLERLEKYFNKDVQCKVVCSMRGKDRLKMEITLSTAGRFIRSEVESDNMYTNLDTCLSKIERQVVKYSDKLLAKRRKEVIDDLMFFDDVPEFTTPKIVKNKAFQLVPISEQEAIEQLELLDNDFYVFLNNKTYRVNVIYKRADGDYGVIDTNY